MQRGRVWTRVLTVLGAAVVIWFVLDRTDLLGSDARGSRGKTEETRSLADFESEIMEEIAHAPTLEGLPGIEHRVTGEGVVEGHVVLHVRDGTPHPMPGVDLQLLGQGAKDDDPADDAEAKPVRKLATTDIEGKFTIPQVPAGTGFVLLLDHAPYRRIVLRGIVVHPDRTTDVGTLTLGAPTNLHGEVLDAKGRPVAGAAVRVLRDTSRRESFDARRALFDLQSEQGFLAEAQADSAGRFSVRDLPPGRYVLRASAPGYATTFRAGVLVTVDENSSAVRVVMDAGAGLEGRVLDDSGHGIAGARVIAVALPGMELTRLDRAEARTDASGYYRLDTLVPGVKCGVEAWAEGYAPTGRLFMPLPAGITKVDWTLQPSGRIEGRVVDADTGEGIADCRVMALVGPLTGASAVSTTSDDDGAFLLPNVNAGPVLLFSAVAEGYQPNDDLDWSAVRGMRVVPGEALWVDWKLRAGGAVEGRVTSDVGRPVPYASVALVDRRRSRQRWTGEITALTDAEGSYRLVGVREGTYDVRVVASGYAPPTDDEVTRIDMPKALGVVTRDVVLRRGGVIEGQVTGPEGTAIRGARITLSAADGHTRQDSLRDLVAVSASNGAYRVTGVPSGIDIAVQASHDAHVHSVPVRLRLNPGATRKVDLRLREGAKLPGRAVDARGSPVAEARVRWGSLEGVRDKDVRNSFDADAYLGPRVLRTDQDGRFLIEGLAPGRYLVKVEKTGFAAWYRKDVDVQGEGVQPDLTVDLVGMQTIRGRVISSKGNRPIPRAFVYARERGPADGAEQDPGHVDAFVSAWTDAEGRYVLEEIPPGVHEVVVWYADGHIGAAQDWRNPEVRKKGIPAGAKGVDFTLMPIPKPGEDGTR